MFTKLLKYEFKSKSGLFAVLSLCSVGASLLGCGLLALFIKLIEENYDNTVATLGGIACVMLWGSVFIALIAYSVAVGFLLLYRFYKHLFTDEGYLTFTLPVTTHQILLSNIVHIAVWSLISVLVVTLDISILLAPFVTRMDFSMWNEIQAEFNTLWDAFGSGYQIASVFSYIAACVYGLIMPLLSITIGSLLTKKHKILASFGIYFGLTTVLSTIQSIFSVFALISDVAISNHNGETWLVLSIVLPGLLYLALGIGGYFLMHYLVDRKLNLS